MPDHPMNRESDKGPIGKVRSFMRDWGWIVSIVGFALLALGFKYTTPREEIDTVKHAQLELKASVDTLKDVTKSQAADIATIVRLQCFNKGYSNEQLNLVGIHCDGIR